MDGNKQQNLREQTKEALECEQKEQELLRDPSLLLKIIDEIHKDGVVGEEDTILTLINKICLRLVKNADPTSSNLLVSDETGGGKDFIVSNTCKVLLPKSVYYHRTDISDKTFDYWIPTGNTWSGKVIHLEDPREDLINGQSFKVMASGGNYTTKVKDQKAVDFEINGKPVIIVTSLKASINDEGMRRWDALRLDTSKVLTKRIIQQALKKASGKIEHNPDGNLRHAIQNLLHTKTVIIPFAEKLATYFPDNLIHRTQINKLLDYVKASAVLHQHQREKDDKGRIIATPFDYDYGRFVFMHLKDEEGVALNKDEEEFMQILRDADIPLSIKEISTRYSRHGKRWIYNNLDDFKTKGLIRELSEWDEHANKDITKLYSTDAFKFEGLPNSSVLSRFYPVFQPPQQGGCAVLQVFSELCKTIDEERKKLGLHTLFEQNQQNQQTPILLTDENQLCYNNNKTKQNQTKPPQEQMFELRDYCLKVRNKGFNLSYTVLIDNFPEYLIIKAIENKHLQELPNGNYEWRGNV